MMLKKYSQYILDQLAEGVIVVDKEFKITFINRAAEKLLGTTKQEIIGKVCKNFCQTGLCKFSCPISEVIKTGNNIYDLELQYTRNDGTLFPVKVNTAVFNDDDGNPIGGIISFLDDSQIKNLEKLFDNKRHFNGIIGNSPPMLEVYQTIDEIADSDVSVLISGETGSGKELVANAIVAKSGRADKSFVKVNCAVLPEQLLASELFGHVKGAFTDASKDRTGRFELADGGTIFLDEIGEMPINMQTQLLRILQEGTFERVGESRTREVDVRVIAATNKNLEEEIKKKNFREDLYYRLNVIPIALPPLRERGADILHLAEFFVGKFSQKYNKKIESIAPDTADILMNYSWPGNVRELENAIEYSFVRTKGTDSVCLCCLPPHIRPEKECAQKLDLRQIEIDERTQELLALLRKNHWNKTKVAKILGVDRSTIHRRLKTITSR